MTDGVRIAPFGDAAVLVELDGATGIAAARRARAVAAAIDAIRRDVPGLGVPVPAATSVLVPFDPRALEVDEVEARVAERPRAAPAAADPPPDAPVHELPVRYGGDDGPDLASVAEEVGLLPADVIELHAATTYEVLFLGFAPGFAYLGELPPPLVVPRLATPRPRVPAGSVAIAGLDDRGLSPCLGRRLAAARPDGCAAVRSRRDAARPASVPATGSGSCRPDVTRNPVLEIVDPGLLLSIQDGGRAGLGGEGVTPGRRRGPPLARRRERARRQPAGRGGARGDAARADGAGARAGHARARGDDGGNGHEDRRARQPGSTVTLRAGDTLALEPAAGARGYLAVPGGIDVPVVLGSRSTALGAGFGGLDGRALRAGDRLGGAEDRTVPHAHWPGVPRPGRGLGRSGRSACSPARTPTTSGRLAFDDVRSQRPGPSARRATAWGCGSTATPIPGTPAAELASHGVVAGTIQLPPDRRPIVLLVDHQPTGGYPVIAVVITRGPRPPRPARARRARVGSSSTTPVSARAALAAQDEAFAAALAQLRDAARWDDLWRGAGA